MNAIFLRLMQESAEKTGENCIIALRASRNDAIFRQFFLAES